MHYNWIVFVAKPTNIISFDKKKKYNATADNELSRKFRRQLDKK